MKKLTVKEMVAEHKDRVLALKTTQDISAFILEIGCKTQHRWGKAVEAIKEISGVDYYAIRDAARAGAAAALSAAVTHEVELFVDAKMNCNQFGITDKDGNVVFYGKCFDDDWAWEGIKDRWQAHYEIFAAKKAIWFAKKIAEAVNATIKLKLHYDAEFLGYLSGQSECLAIMARRYGIELEMIQVAGVSNPADKWTTASGFKKWSDNDLAALATPVGAKVEVEETEAEAVAA